MKRLGLDDIAAMRLEGDLREALRQLQTDARAACKHNRATVLAHPDLAERLTEPPCRFTTAEMWTGYIPPAYLEGRYGEAIPNNSPYRAQLVALVDEAARRRNRTEPAA